MRMTSTVHRQNYYRSIFNKYDKNDDGFLNVSELNEMISSHEYENDIPFHVVEKIHKLADTNGDDMIDFTEFVEMLNNPKLEPFFGHYVSKYIRMVVPRRPTSIIITSEILYEDEYTCNSPALGMIIISMIEVIFYCVDVATKDANTDCGKLCKALYYNPHRRYEVYRYFSYMFVHIGVFHLIVNLIVQILLGIPLEMVHRWWRVLIIYFSGVLAGSLATSIMDRQVNLAGASGGVFSLITAHIATIILNWEQMSYPAVQLCLFVLVTVSDVGTAMYNTYYNAEKDHIGKFAHLAGAIAGLLVGLNILRNLDITKMEKILWWISAVTFTTLMTIAIFWNIFYRDYFN